jgi:hypothetical protein
MDSGKKSVRNFLVSRIMMMISTARWGEGTIGEVTRDQKFSAGV